MKSKETSGELLVALGSKDKQWSVLENVVVRNLQNSLVSFELRENFDKCVSEFQLNSLCMFETAGETSDQ